jgi:glucose-1-phosphatase
MIKAIIFDIWKTLGDKETSASKTIMEHFSIPRKNFTTIYEEKIQIKMYNNNSVMTKEFLESFSIEPNEENVKYCLQVWEKSLATSYIFDGMEDLLKRLKLNYKLGILSNTIENDSHALKLWGIHDLFDFHGFSFKLGVVKPNKNAYIKVATKLKVKLEECVFVDDKEVNVEAAKKVGMIAIQIKNVEQVKSDLAKLGVL